VTALLAACVPLAATSGAWATGATAIAVPDDLQPMGLVTKILTDQDANIIAIASFSMLCAVIVAGYMIAKNRFGRRGSIVK